jgi:DNA polymerase I
VLIKPASKEACELFVQGTIALSKMESEGILIDEAYLNRQLKKTATKIKELEQELQSGPVWKIWKKRFGPKANLGSKAQLETIIFDELKFVRSGRTTKTGQYKRDESSFERVDNPFVKKYFECEKLKKARGTYLVNIQQELVNGRIHPIVDLHTVVTYRSGCSRPNWHNNPVRNETIGKIVRRCMIAPKGFQIVEVDISGAEVAWSACYNKDPNMIRYVRDPTSDMHRDLAMQLFKLPKKEVSKLARYVTKNGFTFPQFYGSYYLDCAKNIWNQIELLKIKTEISKIPLHEWLRKKGIPELGVAIEGSSITFMNDFIHHVQAVESDFWNSRFPTYKKWKWDWWNKYVEEGWFRFLTGFVASGLMDRKQVCNAPIQGSAFHHLLWSLIQLQNWMERKKLRSKIVMEIHDSLLMYLHKREVDDVLAKAKEIITKDARKHWKCIVVPVAVETSVAPEGATWFDLEKVSI